MPTPVEVVLVDLRGEGPPVRRRSERVHAALRAELGAVELAHTPEGKPYVPGSARRFNLTHSHELGAIALSETDVGVDVEALDGPRRRRVLEGVLARGEREQVAAAADPLAAFLRAWTRKEALLKAIGCGLRVELREVAIAPDGTVAALPAALGDPAVWTVSDLALDGYAGAVAARAASLAVSVRAPAP